MEPMVDVTPALPGGDKMALILELSQQATDQQDKIAALERVVGERDRLVDEMRAKLRNNSQYLTAINTSRDGGDTGGEGRHTPSKKNNGGKKAGNTESKKTTKKPKTNVSNVDSLFAFTDDDDNDDYDFESGSMAKLSSLLRGVKAPVGGPAATDDDPVGARLGEGETGTGRDSGLGSAGKREEEQLAGAGKSRSQKPLYEWKEHVQSFESGSGLSDSDFEHHLYGNHKVASAPPKLQNRDGDKKLKKKSSSLKKRAFLQDIVADKPPKPSQAFIDVVHEEDSITASFKSGSHGISPVEVS